MADRSPGGVGDGLPALPDGEPVLARWFVVAMLVLGLVAVGMTVFALTRRAAPPAEVFPAAERRTPGTAEVTHDRGETGHRHLGQPAGDLCAGGPARR